ncbi:MAG: glycosyltransferase family 39 protein [Actinomycetota bacterium]|nr:glycosyltransferase family 39 protein [Actinomycetota bacterium]
MGGVETAAPRRATRMRRTASSGGGRAPIAVPGWVWLVALVLASAVVRFLLARLVPAPWIMVDELIYSELAKSFAAGGDLLIREEHFPRYGPVYPILISPAYRLFAAMPDVYAGAKAINAVVMSLAAVPAYCLARRVLSSGGSLLAALLAVAVPSMAYTATLMTENATYPLVLCAVLLLVLTLERPTTVRTLALLAVCGLAFLTRAQALALLPAVAAAPPLLALFRRRIGELRAFVPFYGPLVAGLVALVAVQLARGRGITDPLGAYSFVGDLHYSPGSVLAWLVYHAAELDLYVGIVPFASLLVLLAQSSRLGPREQAFLAATIAVSAAFLVEVAAFASSLPWIRRVAERSAFYVAPLLLIALLLWVRLGLPRPRVAASAAALVAAALPGVLPYGSLLNAHVSSDTLALVPWFRLRDGYLASGEVRVAVLLAAVAAAALFLRLPRRLGVVLPLTVLVYLALVGAAVQHQFRFQSRGALAAATDDGRPDWIDRTVGASEQVAIVWSGRTAALGVWLTEFFNRAAGRVYVVEPLPGGLPEERVTITASGRLRDPLGRFVFSRYAVSDRPLILSGRAVAESSARRFTLYRLDGPVSVAAVLTRRGPPLLDRHLPLAEPEPK